MIEAESVMELVAQRANESLERSGAGTSLELAPGTLVPRWRVRVRRTRSQVKPSVRRAGARLPQPVKELFRDVVTIARRQPHRAVVAQQAVIEYLQLKVAELEQRSSRQAAVLAELGIVLDDVHDDVKSLESMALGAVESGGEYPAGEATARREAAYADFEARFRGGFDEITALLAPYLADVDHLRGRLLPVVDVGPGRGEWMKLLKANDIPAQGIDVNARFVEDAHHEGLDVELGDASVLLEQRPPGSVGAITAFHVVEHLSPDQLERLLRASLIALCPGGVLIMETPNPSNVRVGANSFWLDATHRKPVPAELLHFLAEAHGFIDVQVRFLHPATDYDATSETRALLPEPLQRQHDDVRWALYGPQDYAVVARKPVQAGAADNA